MDPFGALGKGIFQNIQFDELQILNYQKKDYTDFESQETDIPVVVEDLELLGNIIGRMESGEIKLSSNEVPHNE